MTDYTDTDDATLRQIIEDAGAELARRQSADALDAQLAEVMTAAREGGVVAAHEDGTDWTQPTSTVDAYITGDTVTHGGKTWTSTVSPNTWEPGVAGWRAQDDPDGTPAEWIQPSSTIDAYAKGDRVTFEGQVWESVFDGANTWSPTGYPDAWKLVTA